MSSAQKQLEPILVAANLRPLAVPVISNVTAQPHGAEAEIRRKLLEQVTASVRWEDSMRYLLGKGFTHFIELGPGTALSGFMKRIEKNAQMVSIGDAAFHELHQNYGGEFMRFIAS
jgi:[acyl-carrier-protein] S-malonyltransferase